MALIGTLYFGGAVLNTSEKDTFSSDEISCTIMQIYFIAFQEKCNFTNKTAYCKKVVKINKSTSNPKT